MTYKDVRTELQKNKARIIKDINKKHQLHIPWNAVMVIGGINLDTSLVEVHFAHKMTIWEWSIINIKPYIKKGDKK